MPKFIALEKGFDGTKIIYPGEIFECDRSHGLWMEAVDPVPSLIEGARPEPKAKAKVKKSSKLAEIVG